MFFLSKPYLIHNNVVNIVYISSSDEFLCTGLVNRIKIVDRIKKHHNCEKHVISHYKALHESRVVILCESVTLNAVCILDLIISFSSFNSNIKILVISKNSEALFTQLIKNWRGIWHVNMRESLNTFDDILIKIFYTPKHYFPNFKDLVTARQWTVLAFLSQGLSLRKISEFMGISVKTTSIHKNAAFRRIGLNNITHKALLVNAIGNQYRTDHVPLDKLYPHDEGCSKTSGLMPPRLQVGFEAKGSLT